MYLPGNSRDPVLQRTPEGTMQFYDISLMMSMFFPITCVLSADALMVFLASQE